MYQVLINSNAQREDLEFWKSRRVTAIKVLSTELSEEDEAYWSQQLFEAQMKLADREEYIPHHTDPEVSKVFWNLYLDQSN